MIQEGGNTFLPAYDAMGNVHALMTVASATINSVSYAAGDIVAAYEYDAFGQTLRESGAYAANNPFRFSTKYTDNETGLVYYGHRYYSPSLGRFINRDPIGEQGGINLYAFVGNDPINGVDVLGLVRNCFRYTYRWETRSGGKVEQVWYETYTDCFGGDERPSSPGGTNGPTDLGGGGGSSATGDKSPNAPNKPDCAGKLKALANARQLLQHTNSIFTDANAQFAADGRANESLVAAFDDDGLSILQDARDMTELGAQAVADQMGPRAGNMVGNIGNVTAAPFAGIQVVNGVQSIQQGDPWGWTDVGAGVATATSIVLKGATAGPRPLISPGTAFAGGVELAGNASLVGTVGYWYFMGGTRLYYKNQNYKSSAQTVDAVGGNLQRMTNDYRAMVDDAKKSGCL